MKNILESMEEKALGLPDKIVISDGETDYSYQQLLTQARQIGTAVIQRGTRRCPIAILIHKSPQLAASMLGVLYSGNFYTVLDTEMPLERMRRICDTLHPAAILAEESCRENAQILSMEYGAAYLKYEEVKEHPEIPEMLEEIRKEASAADPAYILYTSGSTGMPKGVVVSHQALLSYTDWVLTNFQVTEDNIWGSQTPFYFSMSITDLFGSLRSGGRLQIIPKELFAFPMNLVEYLNRYQVNTIYWVPSALGLVSRWDTFSYQRIEHLQMVLFAGETMPNKVLNYWRRFYPEAFFANLFGPTETTDICTWYPVTRAFSDEEPLPIGFACDNCRAYVLKESEDHQFQPADLAAGDSGELMIGGPFLAQGYYNNPEKTRAAFIQNPLNTAYPEILYRTGDLVSRNEYGELMYLGRKDFQIKHMGYRIELGEIENCMSAMPRINVCACFYDAPADQIVLVYEGRAKKEDVFAHAAKKLTGYMMPNQVKKVKQMPYNANGKIDRAWLGKHLQEL